jgi:hypothetical protein
MARFDIFKNGSDKWFGCVNDSTYSSTVGYIYIYLFFIIIAIPYNKPSYYMRWWANIKGFQKKLTQEGEKRASGGRKTSGCICRLTG